MTAFTTTLATSSGVDMPRWITVLPVKAMTGYLRREAEIGGYEAAAEARDSIAAAYDAITELVGGRSEEVALFDNATHAWNAAFYSVPLRPGDRILTGRAEYGSNVLAYWQAAQRAGAEVVVVPNDAHGQLDVAALAELADERTRLIGVSHVPTSGGLVQPAADIGRIARACGALFLLDATQSAGQFPVNVEAIGCDLLTLGQYLQPSPRHLPVVRYLPPAEFDELGRLARGLGFADVASGPFVRSSYHADEMARQELTPGEEMPLSSRNGAGSD